MMITRLLLCLNFRPIGFIVRVEAVTGLELGSTVHIAALSAASSLLTVLTDTDADAAHSNPTDECPPLPAAREVSPSSS